MLVLFRIFHVETMFGNEGEAFLHACVTSSNLIICLNSTLFDKSSVFETVIELIVLIC